MPQTTRETHGKSLISAEIIVLAANTGLAFSPWVILNDFGGAFAMGAIGGAIWHGIKGARNSPKVCFLSNVVRHELTLEQGERLVGAVSVIKARAPVSGGNFGVWGGMFSTYDCAVKSWRQKEDAWNAITAGFLTGGTLQLRSAFTHPLDPSIIPAIRLPRTMLTAPHICRWSKRCSWWRHCLRYSAWSI
jgi:mitochondrial import inner membrane translocase subunit TIM17